MDILVWIIDSTLQKNAPNNWIARMEDTQIQVIVPSAFVQIYLQANCVRSYLLVMVIVYIYLMWYLVCLFVMYFHVYDFKNWMFKLILLCNTITTGILLYYYTMKYHFTILYYPKSWFVIAKHNQHNRSMRRSFEGH